jgi:Zn-dependent M16 (insulinase) family peptidase
MRELISQQRARFEQSIVGNGQSLAMQAACSGMSPLAKLTQRLSGMQGLIAIKALDKKLEDDAAITAFAESLSKLHQKLINVEPQLLVIAETAELPAILDTLSTRWANWTIAANDAFSLPPTHTSVRQLWVTNTQVNFCAKAYPTVPSDHPDAAALIVLGGFLRNGFLHTAIREKGGAYGGGASQDNNIAAFRFYSYRDPRLLETLSDFDNAIDWMLTHDHDPESLEQAILGVIGSLDKPGSPAGEAKHIFHNELFGRGEAVQKRFRQRILAITLDDLKRVTQTYLQADKASIAVLTSEATRQKLESDLASLNLEVLTT